MTKTKKILAGAAVAVALTAGGGTVVVDQQIDPYIDKGTTLEIAATSTLPEAGAQDIIVDKTQPKITLEKWNGEVAMGITYADMPANTPGARPFLSKNVEWSDGTQKMEVVPLDPAPGHEGGGMEINIILNSAPISNVFNFEIDGAENLDFFYQAPFWQAAGLKAPTENCTETSCFFSGLGTSTRPENVSGSYAVYYKDHANHIEGQTNYATGKAYHIFRPLVTDANGATVWADLSYKSGILTVTVPQDFLDSAVYPVKVDPTFGYTGTGANNLSNDNQWGMARFSISASGTGVSITAFLDVTTASHTVKMNIYQDETGAADVNVASFTNGQTTESTVSVGNDQAITQNFISPPTFVSGTFYRPVSWANNASGDALIHYDTGQTGNNLYNVFPTYGTWPEPSGAMTNNADLRVSIYVTYNLPAAATPRAVILKGPVIINDKVIIP